MDTDHPSDRSNVSDLEYMTQWITTEGMKADNIPQLIDGFIKQLNQLGFAILKSVAIVRTLHPQIEMIHYTWKPSDSKVPQVESNFALGSASYEFPGSKVDELTLNHGSAKGSSAYKQSPFKRLDDGAESVRCKMTSNTMDFEFPILAELKDSGATDYFAISLDSQNKHSRLMNVFSWVPEKSGGFSDADLALLNQVKSVFALCLEMHVNRYVTETLLSVYLGRHSGTRVLNGKIQRGDVDVIDAAIWYSDLRSFTSLSESVDSKTLVSWLNEYFDTIAQVIFKHDGEILKFIGDAILAIFPISKEGEGDPTEKGLSLDSHAIESETRTICSKAMAAAQQANEALEALNKTRKKAGNPELNHGIALHEGEVQYGNIGAFRRLDFTVIGPSVNLTARLEGLCSELNKQILVSDAFASYIDAAKLSSEGEYAFKGVAEKQKVFSTLSAI